MAVTLSMSVHAQDATADKTYTTPPPAPPPMVVAPAPAAPVMVELPVLVAPKNVNDVIRAEDLTIQNFPEKKVHGDMIKDSTQIIGQAARRQLQAGQPLRLIDLHKEQLVNRGDDVALTFHDGSLEITASGKAQESGALGDSIHILNLGSNHVVDAKVIGPKQVEVLQ